ncbi:hypothetical protein [Pseudomonas sp. B28(2017)]|uniref:hypothetical protein n=1 Tax=Pseudomonas sp. B28(2017) TaxID=1981730 RepID=UPI000A1F01EF|nr:hypothetical protein [Pseudomonas sp. B28(2017)]
MASSYKELTAEQVRIDYRKQFSRAGLLPPVIVDAITGDADGLMPITKIGAPIKVDIPEWPDRIPDQPGDPTDTLYLEWLPNFSGDYLPVAVPEEIPGSVTLPGSDFPLRREIPLSIFENYEGSFQFRYRVKMWNASEVHASAPITIDRTGPIRPDAPGAMITAELITTEILDNDDGVVCEIPDFVEDKKEFVQVAVFWMDTVPENEADFPTVAVFKLLPADRKVTVPKAFVSDLGSRTHYVVYFLFDKAGNRSEMSLPKPVSVALGVLPDDLQACSVPLAADGLIDRADAAEITGPTKVHVEQYTGWDRNDGIVVQWKDLEVRTTVAAHEPFPLKITVPWSVLQQTYDFTTGGVQTVTVDYKVLRGDYPTASPGSISVNQNFEIAGPENPDPEPINDQLELIRFQSFSGSSTELAVGDIGEDATGHIKLYDNPLPGDKLTLVYNGEVVSPAYTVTGSESPNQEVPITIPWSVIEKTPVMDDLPMYYTVTRDGVPNPQESLRTTIDVAVERVDLPEPTAPGNPINCTYLVEKNGAWGINVHIPPSTYLKVDVHVVAVWNSFQIDGTTEIPGTSLIEELSVGPAEEQNGINWFIPYEKCLKPTYGGSGNSGGRGQFAYGITVRGETVASDVVRVLIGVFENNGHCVIPRP